MERWNGGKVERGNGGTGERRQSEDFEVQAPAIAVKCGQVRLSG